jgi:hypothetical protein
MSIFLKDCPQCTTANPSEAVFCSCGYCFDPQRIRGNKDSFRYAAHEEKLYLDYLGARVKQAETDLAAAQSQLTRDPENTEKSAQVLLARQALNSARADHGVQVLKLRNLAHRPAGTNKKSRGAHPAAALAPALPALENRSPTAAPPKPAPAHKRASVAAPGPVITPASASTPVVAATPGTVFQAAQARKAEKIVHKNPRTAEIAPQTLSPAALRPGGAAPRLLATPMKDCPHCTANLPLDAAVCGCGFSFKEGGSGLPGLSMSAADLALFRNLALGGG